MLTFNWMWVYLKKVCIKHDTPAHKFVLKF